MTGKPRTGFTLIELVVALVIAALAAASTGIVLSSAADARDGVRGRTQAFGRAQQAADAMATDIINLVRDADLTNCRVAVTSVGAVGAERDEILLISTIRLPTRTGEDQAESDIAEVQYRLLDAPVESSVAPGSVTGALLWRRVDALPDDVQEGGGIASPSVAGVVSLAIQAADAEAWYDQWDSDFDGLPHAIRIVVTASDDSGEYQRTIRRTISIDRTPLPGESLSAAEEEGQEGDSEQPRATSSGENDGESGGDASGPTRRPGRPGGGGNPGDGNPGSGNPGRGDPGRGDPGPGDPGGDTGPGPGPRPGGPGGPGGAGQGGGGLAPGGGGQGGGSNPRGSQ